LERAERLEQLTFLYAGIPIRTFQTDFATPAVDTYSDLLRVQRQLEEAGR
jgi:CMP-2-keto-3-deoxyoctulosonic acid synthetase